MLQNGAKLQAYYWAKINQTYCEHSPSMLEDDKRDNVLLEGRVFKKFDIL